MPSVYTTTSFFGVLLALALLAPVAHAQTIIFSFGNTEITGEGTTFAFDVLVAIDAASATSDIRIGDTQTYINYNTDGFGSAINDEATVTEGVLLQDVGSDEHVIVSVKNNTASRLAITTDFLRDSQPQFSTRLTEEPQQLLHIVLPIQDRLESTELTFELPLMQGQQYMASTIAGPIPIVIASDTDDSPLPVELTMFDAVLDGTSAQLRWQTASETNNAGFEIEHIVNVGAIHESPQWERLDFVEGHGTTLEAQTYSYQVVGLSPGVHRFRLKQVDYDGTFDYSPEVELAIDVAGAYHMTAAYPNPFNPQTHFSLAVARAQEVTVEVFDVLGRRVEMLFEGEMAADQRRAFVWEASAHPSGLYIIRVAGERFSETRRVTLLK